MDRTKEYSYGRGRDVRVTVINEEGLKIHHKLPEKRSSDVKVIQFHESNLREYNLVYLQPIHNNHFR